MMTPMILLPQIVRLGDGNGHSDNHEHLEAEVIEQLFLAGEFHQVQHDPKLDHSMRAAMADGR